MKLNYIDCYELATMTGSAGGVLFYFQSICRSFRRQVRCSACCRLTFCNSLTFDSLPASSNFEKQLRKSCFFLLPMSWSVTNAKPLPLIPHLRLPHQPLRRHHRCAVHQARAPNPHLHPDDQDRTIFQGQPQRCRRRNPASRSVRHWCFQGEGNHRLSREQRPVHSGG